MEKSMLDILQEKHFDRKAITYQAEVWRFLNKKIVFTNGCFDILHAGHIEYLAKASDLGDMLIIGLNSDDSVRRLKGENRPVNNQDARELVLEALHFVDAVVLFDEDTPLELIKSIQPDVLVKGGDYTEETIVGADIVKANGGEIVTVDLVPGYSTTGILEILEKE